MTDGTCTIEGQYNENSSRHPWRTQDPLTWEREVDQKTIIGGPLVYKATGPMRTVMSLGSTRMGILERRRARGEKSASKFTAIHFFGAMFGARQTSKMSLTSTTKSTGLLIILKPKSRFAALINYSKVGGSLSGKRIEHSVKLVLSITWTNRLAAAFYCYFTHF